MQLGVVVSDRQPNFDSSRAICEQELCRRPRLTEKLLAPSGGVTATIIQHVP
jgi:hypothetical protein